VKLFIESRANSPQLRAPAIPVTFAFTGKIDLQMNLDTSSTIDFQTGTGNELRFITSQE
jgi:hypothetical protein